MSEALFPEFEPFQKIPRLRRGCCVTEKIDGTNAQIYISEDDQIFAGSRNRWLSVEKDNFGFCRWVEENREELCKLGPGRHYGEWWGSGIGRGYGLTKDEKRFSLFNSARWSDNKQPSCCHVVPVLYTGPFDTNAIDVVMDHLRTYGSVAASGFMDPEGIVIYHAQARMLFKKTIKMDEQGKGE